MLYFIYQIPQDMAVCEEQTRVHRKSSGLIHALAQIDEHLVGAAYLDKSKARVLEVDDHIRGHRQDYGEGDGVQHIQMTSYRHVVAREQRACESQRAEHREDDDWRIKSSGLWLAMIDSETGDFLALDVEE